MRRERDVWSSDADSLPVSLPKGVETCRGSSGRFYLEGELVDGGVLDVLSARGVVQREYTEGDHGGSGLVIEDVEGRIYYVGRCVHVHGKSLYRRDGVSVAVFPEIPAEAELRRGHAETQEIPGLRRLSNSRRKP